MAEEPFFSSQGSHFERNVIQMDQENIPSSPPAAGTPRTQDGHSSKPRKPPTVTPKRFTRFFTPRSRLSSTSGQQSKAARQLRDITKNGINHVRPTSQDRFSLHSDDEDVAFRSPKRRKTTVDLVSSPLQSSPLKRVQIASDIDSLGGEPAPPCVADDEFLTEDYEQQQCFPPSVRRARRSGGSSRILLRSFGGYDGVARGHVRSDFCMDSTSEMAGFVSAPNDTHNFLPGTAVPFCTTGCNTNSLVAIGDEEGYVRLVDSAIDSDFTAPHLKFKIHSNAIMDVAFNSTDALLATASGDQTARVVDMQTQQVLCVLSGHTSSVKQVRFQPTDDNMITSSSRDGTVQTWDLRCAERGSVQSVQLGQRRGLNEDGIYEPAVRFSKCSLKVGNAHRSSEGKVLRSLSSRTGRETNVSITAFQHLTQGREHLIATASEVDASVKLWDMRVAGRRAPTPLATTPIPVSHRQGRNYAVCSMALSGDGGRLYTLCRDAAVYAYSTTALLVGQPYEHEPAFHRRRPLTEPKTALGPLYSFRHPQLQPNSFYIRLSIRPAGRYGGELLAVGNTEQCPILFPTDERHLRHQTDLSIREPSAAEYDDPHTASRGARNSPSLDIPTYEQGTALIRGHSKEVTSVCWTQDGDLVTVGDDFRARCWRPNAEKARELRGCGEGGGLRWGYGWADVCADWDEEDG